MYEKAIKKIQEADTIALFMHINPDGDCIGSALALYAYLTNMGKTAHCFLEEGNIIRENLMSLPFVDKINACDNKKYQLAIAVDCGSASRLGAKCYQKFLKCDEHLLIDHHEAGDVFVKDYILETDAASTTQIIYKVLKEMDASFIDKNVAMLLYAGLMTDSGSLTFSSTSIESYQVAAELVAYGFDIYTLNQKLLKDTKLNVFKLTNRVLNNLQLFFDNKMGIITFFQKDFDETNTESIDTDGIINRVIDITEVNLAISIAEMGNNAYKIGMRSKGGVDAGACARYFGGGGHFNASGCRIYASYDETIKKLLDMARTMLDA